MTDRPLVSVILVVRNGMPHLREALDSVRALSYPNYELVIQDGGSTDGTLELLRGLSGFPEWSLVSEPDAGIGQAGARALRRCRGEIIGWIDADNRLQPSALDVVVPKFSEYADSAVIYGSCNMIDDGGAFLHTWKPPVFDLLGLLDGTVVPPFATSFFHRARCGDSMAFDESFATVPDFDMWLRLSGHRISRIPDVLADVRIGPHSSTWGADNYDAQSRNKILALNRFLNSDEGRRLTIEQLRRRVTAGIYLWAVDSLSVIGAQHDVINRYFAQTAHVDVRSDRFRRVVARAQPSLPADDDYAERALDAGLDCFEGVRFEDALVYFELLQRSGVDAGSGELAALSRTKSKEVHLTAVAAELDTMQAEINRRDDMLRDQEQRLQGEIQRRDAMLADVTKRFDKTLSVRLSRVIRRLTGR